MYALLLLALLVSGLNPDALAPPIWGTLSPLSDASFICGDCLLPGGSTGASDMPPPGAPERLLLLDNGLKGAFSCPLDDKKLPKLPFIEDPEMFITCIIYNIFS